MATSHDTLDVATLEHLHNCRVDMFSVIMELDTLGTSCPSVVVVCLINY